MAGGVGAAVRFIADGWIRSKIRTALPVGTIMINITGSLVLAFATGMVLDHGASPAWTSILGTGFLGGYTTFSTASVETVRLLQVRRYGSAAVNAAGTLILTVLAVAAGLGLARLA
nr:fluoride efflux transporter CrcB [Spelaeicoccus albus]